MRIRRAIGLLALALDLYAGGKVALHDGRPKTPDVTVFVDDPGLFNLQVKYLAGRILGSAGVQISWREGKPKPDTTGGMVIVALTAEARSEDKRRGILAHAKPFGDSVRSITVFSDSVQATAQQSGVKMYRLTAHVLAHEIGHVLERLDRHSDNGLMKARWTTADYQEMASRELPFAEEDLDWIHTTLKALRGAPANEVQK